MLLEHLHLKNLLSFGPEAVEIELRPLTVLIGPNGSGKSNFIEAIGLLRAAADDDGAGSHRRGQPEAKGLLAAASAGPSAPLHAGRGVADWIWQGEPKADSAHIEAVAGTAGPAGQRGCYCVEFAERNGRFAPIDRRFVPRSDGTFDMEYMEGFKQLEHNFVSDLGCIRLYRDWTIGHSNVVRSQQKTGHPNSILAEDYANLALVLNRLSRNDRVRERMVEALRLLYEDISGFYVDIEMNNAQIFVQEQNGDVTVPATRLSDGTIRYLTLLTILCDPSPPPLVCIEEPELGFHPDILPGLAELLLEASERSQLVVTTHSEVLVDALTEQPECVVVCEKEDGQTKLRRLSQSDLEHWLDKYRLGELWSSGEIGGNRW